MHHLEGLNERQREAVLHTDGPLLVLAGAGAGKTKTITHRIAHLIAQGTAADAILAVTFTNKAAAEMRERATRLLTTVPETNLPLSATADGRKPFVATFHSLGVRLLREHAHIVGVPRSFTIWDRADSKKAVKEGLKETGLDQQYDPGPILARISHLKSDGLFVADFNPNAFNPKERAVAEVWKKYERIRAKEKAFDFDDLLLETLRLLRDHDEVRARIQARWTHILIDEYQDTNYVQYDIARILAGERKNICAVGDLDQCVYTWRKARIENLLSFEKNFPGAQVIMLEQNYRSTQTIVEAANQVIKNNRARFEKTLFTQNAEGELLGLMHTASEADEAHKIAELAEQTIADGTPPKEIAVLYRANYQSRALEEAFLYRNIPYRVLGTRFFERREVKDVLSFLRAALNPENRGDLARIVGVPPRGIGKATLTAMLEDKEESLSAAARAKVSAFRELLKRIGDHAHGKPASETLRYIVQESGIEAHLKNSGSEEDVERLQNIGELITLATKYDSFNPPESSERLLEDATLMSDQDNLDARENVVSLMTVHAAKGLEFDTVFITGLEEGLFPQERRDEESDPEEERRLFYVALTRARKKVFLSYAATRMVFGSRNYAFPSSFLNEIDASFIEHVGGDAPGGERRRVDLIDF